MSDVEKAYSDYMSKKSAVWSQIAELWQGLYLRVEPHLMDIFSAGYTAAQSQSGWVPIRDIPEEWKDGRGVLLTWQANAVGAFDVDYCKWDYKISEWWSCEQGSLAGEEIKDAMLPPPSPKEQG